MGQGFGVWSDQGKHEKRLQRAPGSARWECFQWAPAVAPLSPHEVRGRGERRQPLGPGLGKMAGFRNGVAHSSQKVKAMCTTFLPRFGSPQTPLLREREREKHRCPPHHVFHISTHPASSSPFKASRNSRMASTHASTKVPAALKWLLRRGPAGPSICSSPEVRWPGAGAVSAGPTRAGCLQLPALRPLPLSARVLSRASYFFL